MFSNAGSSIPFVGAIDGWSEVHITSLNGNITVNGKVLLSLLILHTVYIARTVHFYWYKCASD